MNIYIKMEILDRELEGRLLLALAAAERGHDVLLGSMNALLSHRLWLTPGIYHDKSLTPKPGKVALHRRLADAGFAVTSQDEESGLKQPDYAPFARRRFSTETLGVAAAALTWGPHDTAALHEMYPDASDRIRMTGSPRVDLWRPELRRLHGGSRDAAPLPGIDPSRPVVLVAPGSIPFRPNDFWTMIRDARPRQFKDEDDPREWSHYSAHATAFAYTGRLVRAVRLAAHALPHVQIVVRPHPKSADGAWEAVLGPVPDNVIVTRDGSSGRWLAAADAMVHNGSTTGVEAAAGGVAVVSFQPHGEGTDLFTNRVGEVARDEEGLIAVLRRVAVRREGRSADPSALAVLGERFAALDGRLAVDRIVDVWDDLDDAGRRRPNAVRRAALLSGLHQRGGRLRTGLRRRTAGAASEGPAIEVASKFPPIRRGMLDGTLEGMRRSLDRFADVEVEQVGPHLVHVRHRAGARR
jgi:surface carbohydrate biosynthesis protein